MGTSTNGGEVNAPLQQAVYELLSAGGLTVPGTPPRAVRVYDNVPEGTATPYVTIGEDSLEPDDTDDSRGAEGVVEVVVWTGKEHAGRATAKLIADQIYELVHQAALTVTGYTLARLFWDSSGNFDEVDGLTRRTVLGVRVLLQE